jgi:xanthine dehydrogenase accessory factor
MRFFLANDHCPLNWKTSIFSENAKLNRINHRARRLECQDSAAESDDFAKKVLCSAARVVKYKKSNQCEKVWERRRGSMTEIYQECCKLLQMGQPVVMATVFEAKGSAPRVAGARMLVRQDGSIRGTIGGGRLEHDAVQLAITLFEKAESAIYSFDLTGSDVAGMDMICGGKGEVWLHYFTGNAQEQSVCQAVLSALASRQKAWLVTEISGSVAENGRQFALLDKSDAVHGSLQLSSVLVREWSGQKDSAAIFTEEYGGSRFLVEQIRPLRTVLIFGAGHVSQQVAPLCERVGFRVVVLDDRAEFANHTRFSAETEIQVLDSFAEWAGLVVDENCYIVILTRGHIHDKTVLGLALQTSAGYIGMIGSRRKRDKIYQALRDEGITQEQIARVHSPIGLDIGAETPEELAVSIVGELIQRRAAEQRVRGG